MTKPIWIIVPVVPAKYIFELGNVRFESLIDSQYSNTKSYCSDSVRSKLEIRSVKSVTKFGQI